MKAFTVKELMQFLCGLYNQGNIPSILHTVTGDIREEASKCYHGINCWKR